jgi:hypothetical protein
MTKTQGIKFNASDVLGALALEANRIVAAADAFSAGASFPEALKIKQVLDRMGELNDVLIGLDSTVRAMEAEQRAVGTVN